MFTAQNGRFLTSFGGGLTILTTCMESGVQACHLYFQTILTTRYLWLKFSTEGRIDEAAARVEAEDAPVTPDPEIVQERFQNPDPDQLQLPGAIPQQQRHLQAEGHDGDRGLAGRGSNPGRDEAGLEEGQRRIQVLPE